MCHPCPAPSSSALETGDMSEIYEEHTETLAVPKFYGQFIRYHSQINKQVPEAAKKLPRWAIFLGAADLYSIDLWAGTFIEFFAMLFLFPIHCNVIVHSVKTYGPSGRVLWTTCTDC